MTTEWLDDACGPDGVRVTVAVEPAVQRLVRERDAWLVPPVFPGLHPLRRLVPQLLQTRLLGNRWAVVVEADSGERRRLLRASREEALEAGRQVREAVLAQGVAALPGLD